MSATLKPSDEEIVAYRSRRFRLEGETIATREEAEQLVRDCGMVLLVSADKVLLPSLADAVNGGPYSFADWDSVMDRIWKWKSEIAARRQIGFGKLLKDRVCFAAPDILELLYVVAAQDGRDHEGTPPADRVSREALRLYQALQERPEDAGPDGSGLGAKALRKAAGFIGKGTTPAFNRALLELQRGCYVLQSGAADEGAWASNKYDLTSRLFPDIMGAQERISVEDARAELVERYLATVGMAEPKQIGVALGVTGAAVAEALASGRRSGRVATDEQAAWWVAR